MPANCRFHRLALMAFTVGTLVLPASLWGDGCEPELELLVRTDLGVGQNLTSGVTFPVRIVTLSHSQGSQSLYENRPVGRSDLSRLSIKIETSQGTIEQVNLPDVISNQVLNFILYGPPDAPFDCHCFVKYANGAPHQWRQQFRPADWKREKYDGTSELRPGQAITLGTSSWWRDRLAHSAIYLGHGQYLSKFGPSSSLMVTDLDSMKRAFNANTVWTLTPVTK